MQIGGIIRLVDNSDIQIVDVRCNLTVDIYRWPERTGLFVCETTKTLVRLINANVKTNVSIETTKKYKLAVADYRSANFYFGVIGYLRTGHLQQWIENVTSSFTMQEKFDFNVHVGLKIGSDGNATR